MLPEEAERENYRQYVDWAREMKHEPASFDAWQSIMEWGES